MTRNEDQRDADEARDLFSDVYRTHYAKVVAYARRRVGSAEDADEVVAATFEIAWRRLDVLLGADEPLAWLYGVARRCVLSHYRDMDKRRLVSEMDGASSVGYASTEHSLETRDELERVMAAARTLSETDQEILRLVGWEESSRDEIAEILGISRMLVRTRINRARRRLRVAFAKREHGSGSEDGGR